MKKWCKTGQERIEKEKKNPTKNLNSQSLWLVKGFADHNLYAEPLFVVASTPSIWAQYCIMHSGVDAN